MKYKIGDIVYSSNYSGQAVLFMEIIGIAKDEGVPYGYVVQKLHGYGQLRPIYDIYIVDSTTELCPNGQTIKVLYGQR